MNTEPLQPIPCQGKSAVLPVILVDTREQTPLAFTRLPSETASLATGDYSCRGLELDIAIERKSIADLVQSLTTERDRFMRELQRMRSFPFCRLLVIGGISQITTHRYRSNCNPKSVINSLHAIESRGIPVVFSLTKEEGAILVEDWIWWRCRHVLRESAKLQNALYAQSLP